MILKTHFFSRLQLYGLFILVAGIVVSALFQSRAFVAGFVAGLFFFLASTTPKRKNLYWLAAILLCSITVLILSFGFKTGSTQGRILVYKITLPIYLEHWKKGIGYGNFKSTYPLYQAKYFENNHDNISEIMLADNTYYAFNDYWQFLIEGGIKSIIVLLIGGAFLVILYHRSKDSVQKKKFTLTPLLWSVLMAFLLSRSIFLPSR